MSLLDKMNSNEKPIYEVFLKNRDFIENNCGESHTFSFLEDNFDPESVQLIRRFSNIGNQTFIYAADGPVKCSDSVETESVFLTCKSFNIHRSYNSKEPEINIDWSDIDEFVENYGMWSIYKIIDGNREFLGSFRYSSLTGKHNNSYSWKWMLIFKDAIKAAKTLTPSDMKPEFSMDAGTMIKENRPHPTENTSKCSSHKSGIQDSHTGQNISTKSDIVSAYKRLLDLLSEAVEEVGNLKGVNSRFDEIQGRIASTIRSKVNEANVELSSALKYTTWDNLVIAFFGETNAGKSTIIETFRILFDENRKKEDGLIVGYGGHDFTKTYNEYKLSIAGVPFTLIDVPGIEGNEDDFKDVIKTALHKAHCVFYVQGHNKKPDAASAIKIKKYLGDWVKVYSVFNVRGGVGNYDEEEERKTLLTQGVRKTENLIKAEFQNILGDVYAGNITLQGLLAMSAKANFSPEREDLIRGQQKLLKYFDDSTDEILRFSQFQTLVEVVKNKASNFKQEIIEANKQKLISLAGKIGAEIENGKITEEESLGTLETLLKNIRQEICNNRLSNANRNIKNRVNATISSTYGNLESRIFSLIEEASNDIKDRADHLQSEILGGLPSVIGEIVNEELNSIKDSANRKIKNLNGVKLKPLTFNSHVSEGIEIDFSGAFENLDLEFEKFIDGVGKIAGTVATGAGVGSLFGPAGTLIGAGIGALAGTIGSLITADDGKATARKSVSEAISNAKNITFSSTDKALQPIYKDITNQNNKLKNAINTELENIENLSVLLEKVGEDICLYIKKINNKQYGRI